MPCYDHRDHEPCAINHDDITRHYQDRIDSLTAMLCEALKIIEKIRPDLEIGNAAFLSQEMRDWWRDHKKWDEERGKK